MSVLHQDVTIPAADSKTGEIDISDRVVVAIEIPSVWTAATVSFTAAQKSGGTFVPVFDAAGTELEITAAASRVIVLAPDATRGFRVIKLNSGPSSARVVQAADRILNVTTIEDDRA